MDPLELIRDERQAELDAMEALLNAADAEKRDLTEDEETKFNEHQAKADKLAKQLARRSAVAAGKAALAQLEPRATRADSPTDGPETREISISEVGREPTHIRGPNAAMRAYRMGLWFRGQILGFEKDRERMQGAGIPLDRRTMTTTVNAAGGFLVPQEFSNEIIRLVQEYGVGRQLARIWPMSRDTINVPRRTGGVTTYFPGEGGAITASDIAVDQVQLTARKLACLTYVSSELLEDSAIGIGDLVTNEIALAFATKEDQCVFLGDGTSAYGGIEGLATRMVAINGTGEGGGISLGTSGAWASITLADFNRLMGYCANMPGIQRKWYCHRAFFFGVMDRLARAAGGVSFAEMSQGMSPMFLGFPVVLTNALPSIPDGTANEIVCYFGDGAMASSFGDRRSIQIAISGDYAFNQDLIAIRGTERFDFVAHDLGTATVGGPLTAMLVA